jgi:uracil-DNA glycosylase family 4
VPPATEHDVAAELEELSRQLEACGRCRLGGTRTRLVFGEGDPYADLMFVGEAPGYHEDKQGRPFVGAAGKLLADLLESIGLSREQVYITNVLKSRPPSNRDPQPDEVEACKPFLLMQIGLIQPRVICTLGNFATKLLSGSPLGITRVHGQPQMHEVGGHRFYLYPIFHPAAALYTPSMLETLRADFLRLPDLLRADAPGAQTRSHVPAEAQPGPPAAGDSAATQEQACAEEQASLPLSAPAPDDPPSGESQGSPDPGEQLGLF